MMRRASLPFGLLALICALAISCTSRFNPEDPFARAKWIGTSEKVLYADFLPQYLISADIMITDGRSSASLLMGGNDPRLMDADLNIMGVENGPDESFVQVELDREFKRVYVYRTGYTQEDKPNKNYQSFPLADSLLVDPASRLTVAVTYSEMRILLNDTYLGQANVGPLGHGGDYITYPQLSQIGWLVKKGDNARVSNIEVREVRKPNALLYHLDGMAA